MHCSQQMSVPNTFTPGCEIYEVLRYSQKSCSVNQSNYNISLVSLVEYQFSSPSEENGFPALGQQTACAAILGIRKIVCKCLFCIARVAVVVKFHSWRCSSKYSAFSPSPIIAVVSLHRIVLRLNIWSHSRPKSWISWALASSPHVRYFERVSSDVD